MKFLETIVHTDLPFIADGYTVLHYDQEPILFTGFNNKNSRIIGSAVETNYELRYEIHFHTIVAQSVYKDFINKKISYRKILSDSGFLFAVKSSFDETSVEVYAVNFEEIPEKFLPSPDSFCPDLLFESSLEYALTLEGLEANRHLADPNNVNTISNGFIGLITDSINSLYKSSFNSKVSYKGAYVESSFKINLVVELTPKDETGKPSLFEDNPAHQYIEFMRDYVDYTLNDLGSEIEAISINGDKSEALKSIIVKATKISQRWLNVDEKIIEESLIESVKNSAKELQNISKTLGEGYSTISVSNLGADGSENVLGFIDSGFKERIENVFSKIEGKVDDIKDPSARDYEVYIDHLNASPRTGNAIIHEKGNVWKPKFRVKGEKPLNNSRFSESLHKKKTIKIKAIATRDGLTNEIKSLSIEDDQL